MPSLEETILLNYGGYKKNNLLEILQLNDFENRIIIMNVFHHLPTMFLLLSLQQLNRNQKPLQFYH